MKPNTLSTTRSLIVSLNIDCSGECLPVDVELRRQPRARYFRLRAKTRSRALLTLPWHASYEEAQDFLEKNLEWLGQHLATKPGPDSLASYMNEHARVAIRGRVYPITFSEGFAQGRLRTTVDRDSESVIIHLASGDSKFETETWVEILKSIAKVQLDLRVCDLSERLSIKIPGVSVRDQESRWGSCSSSGRLSLNWRLIILPPVLQDYVIYHELAHLSEHNHSSRFWDLLHRYDPRAGRHDQSLSRDYGFLMNFGRG